MRKSGKTAKKEFGSGRDDLLSYEDENITDENFADQDLKELNELLSDQEWMHDDGDARSYIPAGDRAKSPERMKRAPEYADSDDGRTGGTKNIKSSGGHKSKDRHVHKKGRNRHGKKAEKTKKNHRAGRTFIWIILIAALLITVIAAAISITRMVGEDSFLKHKAIKDVPISAPDNAQLEDEGQIVTYNGKKYVRNNDLISILCMGIDKQQFHSDGEVVGQGGQADSLFLILFDSSSGRTTLLNISRDSMVETDRYDASGNYYDAKTMQLCLAYAYGDGKHTSCENTVKSVSRLLYGMPVDAYISIDLPAIAMLNDAVGGVEVTVLEDLSQGDPALTKDAVVTLKGSQAEMYVRTRQAEGADAPIDSNNARMARQRQYVQNFANKVISMTKKDLSLPVSLFNAASPYMVTDIDVPRVTYLISSFSKYRLSESDIVTVPGKVVMGKEFAEYHVDDEALYEIILSLFYREEQ